LEKVNLLPEELRMVVMLHGYLDLPQSEIAQVLRLHPKEVSRRWNTARDNLRSDRNIIG
jgi:DNA-directed RNA polymerase specialized sigma24 family protein